MRQSNEVSKERGVTQTDHVIDNEMESVAMGPILATSYEELWAALTKWKTADMLVESGGTDNIVTNIDAFLDFLLIQQEMELKGFYTGGQRLWDDQNFQREENSNANSRKYFVCLITPQTPYQSQDARSGDIASLSRTETQA